MSMGRAMALDLGEVRIGVAMSDIMKIIANGYETYKRVGLDEDIAHVIALVKANSVDTVVIGLPINMDGTEGERVAKSREFGALLSEKINAKIVYQDERLTTVTAQRVLIEADMRREKRKNVVDQVAATIILQTYLAKL